MTTKELKGIPVLKGFVDRSGRVPTISVWCPFCKEFHIHGWPKSLETFNAQKYGQHRVAHCTNQESPFKNRGYLIKEFTKKEYAEISRRKNECQ